MAQGDNSFAALGQDTYWSEFLSAQPANGEGWYIWRSESGAAAAIVTGTIAQILEANPDLTGSEVQAILQETAIAGEFTGDLPNLQWGYGKLDIEAAVGEAAVR